jgi:hypothetical protein
MQGCSPSPYAKHTTWTGADAWSAQVILPTTARQRRSGVEGKLEKARERERERERE